MGLTRLCGGTFVWDYKWEDRGKPITDYITLYFFIK